MSFRDIYGHARQIDLLRNSIKRNRVAHAYLFSGMPGVGKKTTALAFAKALNCINGGSDGCEHCPSCRKIAHGAHPDLVVVKPQGIVIKIGDIRELQKQMQFRPFEGRRRVVIIEDAHRMNDAAANALLKTLEEPMPYNVLILLTSRYGGFPRTILSRCQKIRFNPVRPATVKTYLMETRGMEEEDAAIIAAASQGSIGRIPEREKESRERFKRETIEKIAVINRGTGLSLFSIAHEFGDERAVILEKLGILREWLRDVLVLKETGRHDFMLHRDLLKTSETLSGKIDRASIIEAVEAVARAIRAVERNANKQLTLESMVFTLFHLMSVENENEHRNRFSARRTYGR